MVCYDLYYLVNSFGTIYCGKTINTSSHTEKYANFVLVMIYLRVIMAKTPASLFPIPKPIYVLQHAKNTYFLNILSQGGQSNFTLYKK